MSLVVERFTPSIHWRLALPTIERITFDDASYKLISNLIARLKRYGDFAVYALPRMHNGKGEIRLAHHGPDIDHRNGRGVFAKSIFS
jgi:hypothetical protein